MDSVRGQNNKVFIDNWFIAFSLKCALKEMEILALGSVRILRLLACSLKTDQVKKKLQRREDGYRTEA